MQPGGMLRLFCRLQDCSVLVSLYRMGLISTQDGGKTFAYRRAA